MLCLASEVFPNIPKLIETAELIGEIVWVKGMVKKGFKIDPFSGVPFQKTEEKVSQLRRGAVWNPEKKK